MSTLKVFARRASARGKLRVLEPENNPSHLSGRLVLRDEEGRIFLLNEGDVVTTDAWRATVKPSRIGNEYLNGKMGMLFTRKEAENVLEERAQSLSQRMKTPDIAAAREMVGPGLRHYFISFPPEGRAEMEKWIDALVDEAEVSVQFRIPLFAEPSEFLVAGYLLPFHEQGMEDNIAWSIVDSQKVGYGALHLLREGDKLLIYRHNGRGLYWCGMITAEVLECLNGEIRKWGTGRTNPTKLGAFLTKAFTRKLPAVVIKR